MSFMGTSILASSLLLLPITTTTYAQTATSAPETTQMETSDNDDNTGLWGLLGLTGLLGLAGLRRRPEHGRTAADPRERNRV